MKIRFAYAIAAVAMMAATACQPGKTKSQGTQAEPTQTARQDTASREDEPKISFTMADMNGNNVAVADEFAKHKVTIIDFWASWCGPCRQEMPSLVKTYDDYKDKGLGIIGVSLDEDKEQWTGAVSAMGMTWTQLSDLQGWHNSAAQMYGIQAIPFTIVVDNEGKVLAAGLRGEELTAFIAQQLNAEDNAARQQ